MNFSNLYQTVLILFLSVVLISCQEANTTYQLSNEDVLSLLDLDTDVLFGESLEDFKKANEDKYILVDLSSPSSFRLEHEEGAINIPLTLLLDEEHQELLNGEATILLSGLPLTQSAGALVLLKRLGYDKVKIASSSTFPPETAQYDFAATFKTTKEKHAATIEAGKPKPVVVEVPARKKAITPKPKPKKKAVVEEEEGC